jgi:hypothetical protein
MGAIYMNLGGAPEGPAGTGVWLEPDKGTCTEVARWQKGTEIDIGSGTNGTDMLSLARIVKTRRAQAKLGEEGQSESSLSTLVAPLCPANFCA